MSSIPGMPPADYYAPVSGPQCRTEGCQYAPMSGLELCSRCVDILVEQRRDAIPPILNPESAAHPEELDYSRHTTNINPADVVRMLATDLDMDSCLGRLYVPARDTETYYEVQCSGTEMLGIADHLAGICRDCWSRAMACDHGADFIEWVESGWAGRVTEPPPFHLYLISPRAVE